MVYLLQMGIFHGYVSHNQMVLVFVGNSGETHLFLQFSTWCFYRETHRNQILRVLSRKDEKRTVPFVLGGRGFHWCIYIIYIHKFFLSGRAMIIYNQLGISHSIPPNMSGYIIIVHQPGIKPAMGMIPRIQFQSFQWRRDVRLLFFIHLQPRLNRQKKVIKSDQSSHVLLVHKCWWNPH